VLAACHSCIGATKHSNREMTELALRSRANSGTAASVTGERYGAAPASGIGGPSNSVVHGVALITLVWLMFLSSLLVLRWLGYEVGFAVWPLGEDRNWIEILQKGPGAGAASEFWSVNDRNPLSPWWYILFRPLILDVEPGLLLIRYATGLALALATYILVTTIAGRQAQSFALGSAYAVVLWMANGHLDQVYWNFQAALVCSIVSVIFYAKFVDGGRQDYRLYALSLVTWFLAFASYTIQSGAVLAVAYIAFRRANGLRAPTIGNRIYLTFRDAVPYCLLFILFLLSWLTTMHVAGRYSWELSIARLLESIRFGIWHEDVENWIRILMQGRYQIGYVITATLFAGLALFLIGGISLTSRRFISVGGLYDIAVVIVCLAIPTVVLEASSVYWLPGSRWQMIYQLTMPLFYLSGIAGLVLLMPVPSATKARIWSVAASLVVGAGVLFSLGRSEAQVIVTRHEKLVRDALLRFSEENLISGRTLPFQFILKLERTFLWGSSDLLSPIYSRTWFGRDDISFRLMPDKRDVVAPAPDSFWIVRFGPDSEGVGNAKLFGISVPYDHVDVIEQHGEHIDRVRVLEPSALKDFQVQWNRDKPVKTRTPSPRTCPLTWSAELDPLQAGWGTPKHDDGGSFRWMVARRANVVMPTTCHEGTSLRLKFAHALSQQTLAALSVEVNGQLIQLAHAQADEEYIYEGKIPSNVLAGADPTIVSFRVQAFDPMSGAAQQQHGVAIRQIEIFPNDGR
jgi:hypothetical protein